MMKNRSQCDADDADDCSACEDEGGGDEEKREIVRVLVNNDREEIFLDAGEDDLPDDTDSDT